MSSRNGKIARLSRQIRNELNERLDRSDESPQLLDWLNALPEAQQVVQEHFEGVPISKQNLSEWRQGGFQEWLARRDLCEDASDLTQLAQQMDASSDAVLVDAAATVLAARLGALLANWNGEVDEQFEAKSRVLNRLCRSVVQLQRAIHRANRESFDLQNSMDEKEQAGEEALKEEMVKPCFDMLKKPALAKVFGGGNAGRKIAEYIQAVQRGNLDADLDLLPTDKYEIEEKAAVKLAQKSKTKTRKTAKPLQENEMQEGETAETSEEESESVQVSQTDSPSISPILPISPIPPTAERCLHD
jgi:uncharacterized protein YukE